MAKVLKSGKVIVGTLMGLLILASAVLYGIGQKEITQSYPDVAVEQLAIPTGADAIARGRHIATIWSCTKCHGDDLGGRVLTRDPLIGQVPFMAAIAAGNLTAGNGGIGSSYADTDWVRAIRHGVMPDGRVEAYMYGYYWTMNDQDLGDLIAYIKQASPVDSQLPESSYGPVFPVFAALGVFKPEAEVIDHAAVRPSDAAPGVTAEYGQYLSVLCTSCHPTIVSELRGWNRADFVQTFHTGILPGGKSFGTTMSSRTFTELDDTELNALWLYFSDGNSSK